MIFLYWLLTGIIPLVVFYKVSNMPNEDITVSDIAWLSVIVINGPISFTVMVFAILSHTFYYYFDNDTVVIKRKR